MTGAEARAMEHEKLAAELADLRRKLFSLQSQTVTEKVEDNSQFGKVRKDIARLLTLQSERLAGGAKPPSTKSASTKPTSKPAKTASKPAKTASKSAKPAGKKK